MNDFSFRTDEEISDIYNKYSDTIYRVALMMMKNPDDAQDAVQSAFIKLINSKNHFETDEQIKAWFIVTVRNICRDMLKSSWNTKRSDFEEAVQASQSSENYGNGIWDMVADLDEKYRLPILLHYAEGYKTREIAKILGVTHGQIRTRIHRARKQLKILFDEE